MMKIQAFPNQSIHNKLTYLLSPPPKENAKTLNQAFLIIEKPTIRNSRKSFSNMTAQLKTFVSSVSYAAYTTNTFICNLKV